jgi:hypothetical protein
VRCRIIGDGNRDGKVHRDRERRTVVLQVWRLWCRTADLLLEERMGERALGRGVDAATS